MCIVYILLVCCGFCVTLNQPRLHKKRKPGFVEAAFLGILMDLVCDLVMAAVSLDAQVPKLVSASQNATASGSPGTSAGTRALIILTCLLLLVWSHTEKKRVPGGLVASGLSLFFSE